MAGKSINRNATRSGPSFRPKLRRMSALSERVGEQARAQQKEASRGQCEEAVGNKVTIGHGDPFRSPCLPELVKTFGKVGMAWLQDEFSFVLVKFATGPPQMHAPERSRLPSNPSVLSSRRSSQTSFAPLASRKRVQPCTVKNISSSQIRIGVKRGFRATGVSNQSGRSPGFRDFNH
jgi:hypothetical protein